jgi:ribonuclease E
MTRKRIGQGLIEAFSTTCESCHGRGIHIHTEPVNKTALDKDHDEPFKPNRERNNRNDSRSKDNASSNSREHEDEADLAQTLLSDSQAAQAAKEGHLSIAKASERANQSDDTAGSELDGQSGEHNPSGAGSQNQLSHDDSSAEELHNNAQSSKITLPRGKKKRRVVSSGGVVTPQG